MEIQRTSLSRNQQAGVRSIPWLCFQSLHRLLPPWIRRISTYVRLLKLSATENRIFCVIHVASATSERERTRLPCLRVWVGDKGPASCGLRRGQRADAMCSVTKLRPGWFASPLWVEWLIECFSLKIPTSNVYMIPLNNKYVHALSLLLDCKKRQELSLFNIYILHKIALCSALHQVGTQQIFVEWMHKWMLNNLPPDFPFVSNFLLHLTHASSFRVPFMGITDALNNFSCFSGLLFLITAETDWGPKIETPWQLCRGLTSPIPEVAILILLEQNGSFMTATFLILPDG